MNYVWDHVIFPVKIQILKRIHVPYIRVFVRFKDDKHVMWTSESEYDLILQNLTYSTEYEVCYLFSSLTRQQIWFILQSFYLNSQNALTVYLQVINDHWPFITFRPRLLNLIDGTTFYYLWKLFRCECKHTVHIVYCRKSQHHEKTFMN